MFIEFVEKNKLEYNLVDKYESTNLYENLINECDKYIGFCKDINNDNLCNLYKPDYWIIPKKIKNPQTQLTITFNSPFINYDGNIIPSFIDYYKFNLDNDGIYTDKIFKNMNFSALVLFKKFMVLDLLKKKKINYLGINEHCEKDEDKNKKFLNFFKNVIKFNNSIIGKCIELNNLELDDNFTNLNQFDLNNNIKFDVGFILIRKVNSDIMNLKTNVFMSRLINVLNFICSGISNIGSCFIIYFYGSYTQEFDNIICSLTKIFDKVELGSLEFEKLNFNHIWIILTGYKGDKNRINFFEKRIYYDKESELIKEKIFNFRTSLLIKTINNYYFLKEMRNKKFYLNEFKSQIINYATRSELPVNILHNELFEDTLNFKYHDMQILIDTLNQFPINNIIDYNMTTNIFLYISGLYAGLYKKKISFNIIKSLIDLSEYTKAFDLSIKILYGQEVNQSDSLAIIAKCPNDNSINPIELPKLILTTKKIISILSLSNTYSIVIKGKKYNVFKKN